MLEEGLCPIPLTGDERLRRKGIDPKFHAWPKAELSRDDTPVESEPAVAGSHGDASDGQE